MIRIWQKRRCVAVDVVSGDGVDLSVGKLAGYNNCWLASNILPITWVTGS